MNTDLWIAYAKENDASKCSTCKKGFKRNALKITINAPFDMSKTERLSVNDALNVDNGRSCMHLKCLDPHKIKPCQCMFHESITSLESEERSEIESQIVAWQRECAITRKLKKDLTEVEYNTEDEKDKENFSPGKRKGRPDKRKIKRSRLMPSKNKSKTIATAEPEDDDSLETEDQEDPFFLDLSRDVWFNVFSYLNHVDLCLNVAQSCQALYTLSNMNSAWKKLCLEQVSPKFYDIRKHFFTGRDVWNDYKELFKIMHNKVCAECKCFCGETVYKMHWFYLTDKILCDDCRGNTKYATISKTDIKKKYKLSDAELSFMRCLKSPNPFHRSTPMYRYLLAQIENAVHIKNIQHVRLYLQTNLLDESKDDTVQSALARESEFDNIKEWIDQQLREKKALYDYVKYEDSTLVRKNMNELVHNYKNLNK